MKQVKIWDLATRAVHWLLVAVVLTSFLTGEDEGLAFIIHAYAGFMVLSLLVFRLGWGLIGSRHSRFSSFVYSWAEIKNHALQIIRLKPESYVGHNPLGSLMIFAMLVVLAYASITGFVMVVADAKWLEDIHEVLGSIMQTLVAIHILGVIVEQILTREKLVKAMISGSKELADDQADKETKTAPLWKALILAVAVGLFSFYLFQQSHYSNAVSSFAKQQKEHNNDRKKDDD